MSTPPFKHQHNFVLPRQAQKPKSGQLSLGRIRLAINDTFWEYTKKTKVSGMWLLRRKRTRGITRWIWATVLISLFLLGVFLSLQLWLKFYSYPILNTISSNLAITDVAFPGVTVCSPKVVNLERVNRYIQELYIPPEYDPTEVAAGFEFINIFTDQNWENTDNKTFQATDEVLRLNNISIYQASLKVSAGCEDFVKRCFWGAIEFPCLQDDEYLSFSPSTSYLGPCCSFNYNPKNASYVPFSSNIFGMDGGLSFIGVEGSEGNISTGLLVLVHHPMDFTTEAAASVTITSKSESFVEISPTVQSSSMEVLELSQRKRDCLTSDDVQQQSYRQSSCMLSCEGETILKTCGCHPYHLPTLKQELMDRECKLKDTICYAQNYGNFKNKRAYKFKSTPFIDSFKSVKCEQCLPNCYDVTYATLAYKTDLQLHNYSVSSLYTQQNLTGDTFIVRVYLARQVVPSIRKVTVMSWISLLSDLGGVFNLCLGLSVISLVEFFYYCTYRLYKNYELRGIIFHTQHKLGNKLSPKFMNK